MSKLLRIAQYTLERLRVMSEVTGVPMSKLAERLINDAIDAEWGSTAGTVGWLASVAGAPTNQPPKPAGPIRSKAREVPTRSVAEAEARAKALEADAKAARQEATTTAAYASAGVKPLLDKNHCPHSDTKVLSWGRICNQCGSVIRR